MFGRQASFSHSGFCLKWAFLVIFGLFWCREVMRSKLVSVAVTPNGYADAVYQDRFVMPEERCMPFSTFLDIVEKKVTSPGVFYVQKQCSNLTEEFPELIGDVEPDISWMSKALGKDRNPLSIKILHCLFNCPCNSPVSSCIFMWFCFPKDEYGF